MQAFNGDARVKRVIMERLRGHLAAGELVPRQRVWEDGKGSPAGCAVHDSDPLVYERELGISRTVLPLMETLFARSAGLLPKPEVASPAWLLPEQVAALRMFPVEWLEAVEPGADLSAASTRFILWMLTDTQHGVLAATADHKVREMIGRVAAAHRAGVDGATPDKQQWAALRTQAMAVRDLWPEATFAADAAAASVTEAACWPQMQGGGRAGEETLNGYLRLAECRAAALSGWADDDEQQLLQERDELRKVLMAIPETADAATIESAKSAAVAAFHRRMEAKLDGLGARRNAYLEENRRQSWLLLSAAEQALLHIVRAAPTAIHSSSTRV